MSRPPDTFTTRRLAARRARPDDGAAVFRAYANDPEVTRYLSWRPHPSPESVCAFLNQPTAWDNAPGPFPWILCLRDSPDVVGSIGVTVTEGKALFGYVLARRLWGQGLMAEPLRWLVDWALAQPDIFRAYAFCDADNPASARVMEKAGMLREGILRRWHVCPTLGPEPRDCIICAKVR